MLQSRLSLLAAGAVAVGAFCGCSLGTPSLQSEPSAPAAAAGRTFVSLISPGNLSKIRRPEEAYPSWLKLAPSRRDGYLPPLAYVSIAHAGEPIEGEPATLVYLLNDARRNYPEYQFFWTNAEAPCLVGLDFSGNVWQAGTAHGAVVIDELSPYGNSVIYSTPDEDGDPTAFAFDRAGAFYVLNGNTASGHGASIDVYASKTSQPTVLLEQNAKLGVDITLDKRHDVFMSWVDQNDVGHIDEFAAGTVQAVTLPMKLGFVGGLTLDSAGRLLVVDQSAGLIDVFSNLKRSKPSKRIALKSPSLQCTFNKTFAQLYCTNYTIGSIDVYDYRSGKAIYDYSWTAGLDPSEMLQGIAIFPRAGN